MSGRTLSDRDRFCGCRAENRGLIDEQGVVVADTGDEETARDDPIRDAQDRGFQRVFCQHMWEGIIHSDDDVKLLRKNFRQGTEVCVFPSDGCVADCRYEKSLS